MRKSELKCRGFRTHLKEKSYRAVFAVYAAVSGQKSPERRERGQAQLSAYEMIVQQTGLIICKTEIIYMEGTNRAGVRQIEPGTPGPPAGGSRVSKSRPRAPTAVVS